MKVKVLEQFIDKFNTSLVYNVGEVLDLADTKRVEDLVDRQLVKTVEDVPKKTKKK